MLGIDNLILIELVIHLVPLVKVGDPGVEPGISRTRSERSPAELHPVALGMITERGWDHFRKIESAVIAAVSRGDNLVVATGGGVVLDDNNVKNLHRNGHIVWLKGDAKILKERMEKDMRRRNRTIRTRRKYSP